MQISLKTPERCQYLPSGEVGDRTANFTNSLKGTNPNRINRYLPGEKLIPQPLGKAIEPLT